MKRALLAAAAGLALGLPVWAAEPSIAAAQLWRFQHDNASTGQSSEISAFDRRRGELWTIGGTGIQVLGWEGSQVTASAPFTCPNVGTPNSIAIDRGLVAATFNATAGQIDGWLCLFDAKTRQLIATLQVGATPDMVAFTPDGRRLLVVNEGERSLPAGPSQIDPPGSISIVRLHESNGPRVEATVGFPAGAVETDALRAAGVRIAPGKTASVDIEPEYATIGGDGKTAWITLQENNAIAVLDIDDARIVRIIALGTKSYNSAANAIDPSDQDGQVLLRPVPARSFYQPDAIANYRARDGRRYLVMANEGDARNDDSDVARAGSRFPGVLPTELRRLNISTIDSSATDLVGFGARSFTIRDLNGEIAWDSGNTLDAQAIARGIYADGRSDDKGVEPEGVALAKIGGRTYAFIGMERTTSSAVAMFDISDPRDVRFIDFIVGLADVSPEGLTAFSRKGRHYLAVSNEVSHSTTLYEISRIRGPDDDKDGEGEGEGDED